MFSFSGCMGNGYVKEGKKVYLYQSGYTAYPDFMKPYQVGAGKFRVEGADAATFVGLNDKYGKDKNAVYMLARKVEGMDPDSFQLLADEYYVKDKNHAYYGIAEPKIIEGADPDSFLVIDYFLSKDKNGVYYQDRKMVDADAATFELLGTNGYAKDKQFVYSNGNRIEDADYASFKVLADTEYAKDSHHVYWAGTVVEGADAATFEATDLSRGKDKNGEFDALDRV